MYFKAAQLVCRRDELGGNPNDTHDVPFRREEVSCRHRRDQEDNPTPQEEKNLRSRDAEVAAVWRWRYLRSPPSKTVQSRFRSAASASQWLPFVYTRYHAKRRRWLAFLRATRRDSWRECAVFRKLQAALTEVLHLRPVRLKNGGLVWFVPIVGHVGAVRGGPFAGISLSRNPAILGT
jgi:hypothetical protein